VSPEVCRKGDEEEVDEEEVAPRLVGEAMGPVSREPKFLMLRLSGKLGLVRLGGVLRATSIDLEAL
jgi:hypothetical protein